MKLISYRQQGPAVHVGAVIGSNVLPLDAAIRALPLSERAERTLAEIGGSSEAPSMLKLLLAGAEGLSRVRAAVAETETARTGQTDRTGQINQAAAAWTVMPMVSLDQVTLLAPIPRPGKILGIGRNYGEHAKESGSGPFEKPRVFTKVGSSVQPPGSRIPLPKQVEKLDFEVELAVVIGNWARDIPEDQALAAIAGYTVLHDMSAREFQFDIAPPQTSFAKSFDGATPMGPWLVTADEVPDPQTLDISCRINGEELQHDNTSAMIFSVATLVSYLSRFQTLEPGDVIATGTPSGVGAFRKPPRWLRAGDHVEMTVEKIGTLEHWMV